MANLLQNLMALGPRRLVMLGAVAMAVLASVGILAYTVSRPAMGILYAGLDDAEAGRILAQLQAMKIPHEVGGDGGAIRVAADSIPRVRMQLAQQGLPSAGGVGYELFDSQGALGLTSFMQKVNRLRATEGELVRTIQTLNGVRSARVHLSVPDGDSFQAQTAPPAASVVVRTVTAGLERSQALAVRHLVAAAVPGMRPGAVTVMDANGVVLAAEGEAADGLALVRAEELRAATEQRLARAVEEILVPKFGPGNVRVRVAAEIDLGRETLREQIYDPNGRVERSIQSVNERESSSDRDRDTPTTVEQNLPLEDVNQGTAAGSRSETARDEETTNYEISSRQRERVQDAGDIRRLAVAVVVNGTYAAAADGTSQYQPRSDAELRQVENVVRTAIGFSQARGDQVTVENLQFLAEPPPPGDGMVLAGTGTAWPAWLPWTIAAIAATLLVVLALRPMLGRAFPGLVPEPALAGAGPGAPQLPADPDTTQAPLLGHDAVPGTELAAGSASADIDEGPGEAFDELVDLRSVEGGVSAAALRRLAAMVDTHPEDSINVLRAWIYEGTN
ncbi:flagellar basal-body MS-ring/collar protein FliF [Niveispirillum fermenti]|uniref:flagellar basal-body MS-ring/collar protein FliF n=1 Tax=Niveispirillum fermenti TaxID=1233113 RepID=UPI003A8755E6